MHEAISTDSAPPPAGFYSQAVRGLRETLSTVRVPPARAVVPVREMQHGAKVEIRRWHTPEHDLCTTLD